MFANGYRRAYHYHLHKCGGTSLNAWLEWHVPDSRRWVEFNVSGLPDHGVRRVQRLATLGAFHMSPIVATHRTLTGAVPPDTLRITVLREPVARLLSKVADWRREASAGHATGTIADEAIRLAGQLPLRRYLETYLATGLRALFDNYQVRALACTVDAPTWRVQIGDGLLDRAIGAVTESFDIAGLSERLGDTRTIIAARLGLVPDRHGGEPRNVTGRANIGPEEIADAGDLLEELTYADRRLYDVVRSRFDAAYAADLAYAETAFETAHAATAVERLAPRRDGDAIVMTAADVLLGSGFHGRDGSGTPHCNVWTGPATRSVLYMPCPPGERLVVKLWIRGYAHERLRDRLRFEIDDQPAPHVLTPQPGWREVAEIDACSTRPFLKLTMLLDETLTTEEAGQGKGDPRRRGLAFDRYGWALGATDVPDSQTAV